MTNIAEPATRSIRLLILNPNASQSVTEGLAAVLTPLAPPGTILEFATAPSDTAPPSINDAPTSVQSAWSCFSAMTTTTTTSALRSQFEQADGVLVCCFSDHPLVGMLRHTTAASLNTPCMHILESSVWAALQAARGRPFAILTTGADMVRDIDAGVAALLGSSARANDRYAGCAATNLGVEQMRDPSQRQHVHTVIRAAAARLAALDAGAIVLGCAAMAGFESVIRQGVADAIGVEAAKDVAIVDGAKAGVHLLVAQIRCNFYTA